MRELIRKAIVGTRWEATAKRVHATVFGSRSSLYDYQTIAIMRRVLRRDSIAIDVGAFEGSMLRHMFRFAPAGSHVAFEPLPGRFDDLKEAFPKAHVYPYAVGAEPGTVAFHQALAHPALSGLRRRSIPNEEFREIQVSMETIDRVIPPDLPIALIKIDVEGGELGVFRGGARTLRTNRPVVVFECGVGGADYFGSTPVEIYDFLAKEAGLKVSLLGDWLACRPSLSRDSFCGQFERKLNFYFVAHP